MLCVKGESYIFTKELFGQRLQALREQSGESRKALGAELDVSDVQIGYMETGQRTTTLEKLALICEHYGVSADYLLGLSDEPRRSGGGAEPAGSTGTRGETGGMP